MNITPIFCDKWLDRLSDFCLSMYNLGIFNQISYTNVSKKVTTMLLSAALSSQPVRGGTQISSFWKLAAQAIISKK